MQNGNRNICHLLGEYCTNVCGPHNFYKARVFASIELKQLTIFVLMYEWCLHIIAKRAKLLSTLLSPCFPNSLALCACVPINYILCILT